MRRADTPHTNISAPTGGSAAAPPAPATDLVHRFEQALGHSTEEDEQDTCPSTEGSAGDSRCQTAPLPDAYHAATASSGNHAPRAEEKEHRAEKERIQERHPLGMTHPLDSLLAQQISAQEEGQPAPSPTGSNDAAQRIELLAEQLAQNILVGEKTGGAQEVRISVNPDVLPQTEISLVRQPDGSLTATLVSNDAAAFQTLVAGQADLQARLEQWGASQVRVNIHSGQQGEDADMRRRSRGLTGHEGHDSDKQQQG